MMSELTESLNRITKYLEQNNPSAANWLQPGLSDREIDFITKDLPFDFPLELKELYLWRNGREINEQNFKWGYESALIFPADGYYFLNSLEAVVNNYQQAQKYSRTPNNELEIFQSLPENTGYFYLDSKRVIFYHSSDWEYGTSSYQYSSLTSMMQTIAEGYESGIYENNYYFGDLQNYALNSTKLWWKYNFTIQDLLLKQLQDYWQFKTLLKLHKFPKLPLLVNNDSPEMFLLR